MGCPLTVLPKASTLGKQSGHKAPRLPMSVLWLKPNSVLSALIGSVCAIAFAADVTWAETVYTGVLEPGDAIFAYDGSLYDDYAIQGEAGNQMMVQLQSNSFDPFLAIVGPQGEWLLQNDDISSTNNNAALSFTFPDDQVYYVFVNAYNVSGQGVYTLNMSIERSDSDSSNSSDSNDNEVSVPQNSESMPPPIILNTPVSSDVGGPDFGVDSGHVDNFVFNGQEVDEAHGGNHAGGAANALGLTQTDQQTLLAVHNRYRAEVNVSDLVWSEELAHSAQQWADHLVTTNTFGHSSSTYGENLWTGTAGAFSLEDMVSGWGDEKEFFIPNTVFPNVSTTGNWADVGHYTQLVWSDTMEVGCAIATGNGRDTLVCQYNPPGNYQGEAPF